MQLDQTFPNALGNERAEAAVTRYPVHLPSFVRIHKFCFHFPMKC
jgi:hypothetical protein